MSITKTDYIDKDGNDLIDVFVYRTGQAKANNVGFQYKSLDLSEYFAPKTSSYTSTPSTGFIDVSGNDLINVFENKFILPFTITGSTNYTTTTLSSGYIMIKFKIGNFTVTPKRNNINIYQLFVVGGGANGSSYAYYNNGGRGGQVVFPSDQNLTVGGTPIQVSPSNVFTITVNSLNATNTTICDTISALTLTGTAGGGSTGNGTMNVYNNLYYGGAGGFGGGGFYGGRDNPGFLGGGGGAGAPAGYGSGTIGGAGGAVSIGGSAVGGSGGSFGSSGFPGGIGGGAGGAGGVDGYNSYGSGGGGGGGYYGGGGGGGGAANGYDPAKYSGVGGGGGTGVVLLIYK